MIMEFPYLSAILASSLLGGLAIMLIPDHKHSLIKLVAGISSFISLALSLVVFYLFDASKPGFQFLEKLPWLPSLGISYQLGIDGIGLAMLLLTGIVIFTGVLISAHEFKEGGLLGRVGRPREFFAMLLILVTGVFGVFVSLDLFFLFLFYEIAVLPMYLLIGIWGTGKKEYSAMKLTLYLMLGSAFILLGILALYFTSGLGTFDWFALSNYSFSERFQTIFFPIVFVGFGILAGLWPFHTWSPDGHASAPSAVSMLHAGVLMKLGAFGIIRVALALMPYGAKFWAPYFAVLTIVNIVYGALVAMNQKDLKYVIAYSSVSHMGIVLLGITSLNVISLDGAVFQMFAHGVMTALFFALVGAVYGRTHTRVIADMGGLAKLSPFLAVAFAIGGLASLGLPGTSGFVAEFLVLVGAFRAYPLLAVGAATGVVITAIYVLRVLQKIFFGELNAHYVTEGSQAQTADEFSARHLQKVGSSGHHGFPVAMGDATTAEKIPMAILILVIITMGVWPSLLLRVVNPAVIELVGRIGGLF
ncbi:MAG TPA: NADH-quinone oxidoreductase subunit M [Elusimicrobia bacterium]|nr:MAG: NADH dehydrogenase [Elusimicrobia bacterium RIFOXYA12_FULL_49_49]OGS09725.1 MAG: NADH dehydrogenase [Elusimicrobia bacterium RIFOXYB1_FULL_48_9]OGS14881.1 MAG: NADH dehydrogenase [Elusimicrobia bacterium RIFOXYA2_FULL_47_53]OGS26488.1 MAG: NADH dehydrogenase [Elusimicrobia bacterium RIFOXYB12_FULL_50_12]OGS29849.1 MAG: NADH dehydrogenase [Elusimicrobia bacterium RIFOXYB2_FULL_46_23]HBU69015.1 NADH-quinone oxidoreductase subunit M [Elusimicrobiota bacterium]